MKTQIINITPVMAESFLAANISNRKLSPSRVENLANQMRDGKWLFNGDCIRVSITGRLLDGQHRLSAIVRSGTTHQFILVTGLNDDVFSTIDVGAARSASDFLAIDGFKNTTNLAATAQLVMQYQKSGNPFNKPNGSKKTSKKDIVDFCRDNPLVAEFSARVDNRKKLKNIFSPSAMAFCFYAFSMENKTLANKFIDELEAGYYSYNDSPVGVLRDKLILTSSAGATTKKLGAAMIFRAWQMYKVSAKAKIIRLPNDESQWFTL